MRKRQIATALALGVLGLGAAAGIALAVNGITGSEIGLSAEPVSVIPADVTNRPAPAPDFDDDRHGGDERSGDSSGPGPSSGGGSGDSSGPGSGDDSGGDRKREDREDNSGKGSSGSGKSGSGSGGDDSSGSGGDDSDSSGGDSSGSGSGGDDED